MSCAMLRWLSLFVCYSAKRERRIDQLREETSRVNKHSDSSVSSLLVALPFSLN